MNTFDAYGDENATDNQQRKDTSPNKAHGLEISMSQPLLRSDGWLIVNLSYIFCREEMTG